MADNYIRQEESNVDMSYKCPNNPRGTHKWYFHTNEWGCANCGWKIAIANLICDHCGKINKFARADLVPNPIGLVDTFGCEHCGEMSLIRDAEIQ